MSDDNADKLLMARESFAVAYVTSKFYTFSDIGFELMLIAPWYCIFITAACATALLYDYILTIGDEVVPLDSARITQSSYSHYRADPETMAVRMHSRSLKELTWLNDVVRGFQFRKPCF